MNRPHIIKLLCIAAMAALSACTTTAIPGGTGLRDGAAIKAPLGWVEFCKRNAGDPSCEARPLDKESWNELQGAQAEIRSIRYVEDRQNYGKAEYWQVADKSGDCEDLALAARQRLLAEGWPASVLRLASVFTETRETHAVLTVEVNRGGKRETLVIDNRNPEVMSWNQLKQKGYWFVTRQAAHGGEWVTIPDGQGKGWKTT